MITRTTAATGPARFVYANSPIIVSVQSQPHRRLREVVERHRDNAYRRPISAPAREAWLRLRAWLDARPSAPLILDSGCGTGASSLGLAQRFSDASVIGIDQSADRLARLAPDADGIHRLAPNALTVRARLEDLWRLMAADGVTLQRHLLWYPNPWPKPVHLLRRWHAHPVLPTLLSLGGELELRSNWRVYIDEFALALAVHGLACAIDAIAPDSAPVTPFERKYRDSGHPLWRLSASLPGLLLA